MRINFGQYNQQYYEYGNQRSKNQNYVKKENKLKTAGVIFIGLSCIGVGFLHKGKKY